MTITIGSRLITKAKLHVPFSGRWLLEAHFDGAPPSGKVTVQWGAARLVGTVLPSKSGEVITTGVATIVGGIGWQTEPPAAWLVDTMASPARVASQLAQAIGETLVIGQGAMREGRSAYSRARQYASDTLRDLLAPNAIWWLDFDGTTNAAADRPAPVCSAEVLHFDPATRRVKLEVEDPSQALVGATIAAKGERLPEAQRIRQIDITADGERGVECWALCEESVTRSRVAELIELIASNASPNHHATIRAATVQSQSVAGLVSLRYEERDKELSDSLPVNVWAGVPGVSADLFNGTRMLLGFDRANPDNPFAALFSPLGQTGHVPKKVRHEANEEIRLVGNSAGVVKVGGAPTSPVALATNLVTYLQALEAYFLGIDAYLQTEVGPAMIPLIAARTAAAGNISSIAATKLEAK